MKYLKTSGIHCLMGLMTLLLLSCSDSDNKKIAEPGTMIATVDGQAWTSSNVLTLIYNGTLFINGQNGSKIFLTVNGELVGDHEVDGDANISISSIAFENDTDTYYSTYTPGNKIGFIKITEMDKTNHTLSGSFSVKVTTENGAKTLDIKDGSFSKIPYTDPTASNNKFTAKVNGTDFAAALAGGTVNGDDLVLNFTDQLGNTIGVVVPEDITAGTYSFGSVGNAYFGTYSSGNTSYESTTGSITITDRNVAQGKVKGTFNFNGEIFPDGGGSVNVTDASFEVYL